MRYMGTRDRGSHVHGKGTKAEAPTTRPRTPRPQQNHREHAGETCAGGPGAYASCGDVYTQLPGCTSQSISEGGWHLPAEHPRHMRATATQGADGLPLMTVTFGQRVAPTLAGEVSSSWGGEKGAHILLLSTRGAEGRGQTNLTLCSQSGCRPSWTGHPTPGHGGPAQSFSGHCGREGYILPFLQKKPPL